jgi:hypothetical protein
MQPGSDSHQSGDWTYGSGAHALRLATPKPGERFGPYQILGELGRGAMGVVLAARDELGRDIALKLLNQARPSEQALARFAREGEVMALLRHPGIVAVHASGVVNGCPFLACTRIEGRTLDALLAEEQSPDELLRVVEEIAEAVGYAHEEGVVHRDLKPANVLVDREGHPHVADFGLAQAIGLERLTLSGALVGTPQYMAPEQIVAKRKSFGPHTDTWALGVILYRALTGRDPFEADRLTELSAMILQQDPLSPRDLDPSIAKEVQGVCLKALRKAPEDRYANGRAFAADLALARQGVTPFALRGVRGARLRIVGALLALILIALASLWGASRIAVAERPTGSVAPTATPKPELSRETKRLLAKLDEVLGRPAEADALGVSKALARLAPRLRSNASAQARLEEAQHDLASRLALQLDGEQPLGALRPTLETLGAIRRLLRLQRPLFSGSTKVCNKIVSACAQALASHTELVVKTLEALEGCGVRSDDPVAATQLFESCMFSVALRADRESVELARRRFLAGAKLDIGSGGHRGANARDFKRFGPRGDDPWAAYCRLRFSLDDEESRIRLLETLKKPPAGLDLGPIHWAESVRFLARHLRGKPERLELLLEAARRDPRSVFGHQALAYALADAERFPEAIATIERCCELYVELGYGQTPTTGGDRHMIWTSRVEILARADERARARAAYGELPGASKGEVGFAAYLLREFPWLEDSKAEK